MRRALVFGGSGQIGRPLLDRLIGAGWDVVAVSRRPQANAERLRWLHGDLDRVDGLPASVDVIFSCGPLDRFARWYAQTPSASPRVIAFGSTSVAVKHDSADAAEREVAMRLREGERSVLATADARGAAATLLRPTLVYGEGGDRTLSRIAAIAARWHCFVLPRDAIGLRQPVHVGDLAQATFDVIDAPTTHGRTYALPGGETLSYREMVARVLAARQPPATLYTLPPPLFRIALVCAHAAGVARDFGAAHAARLRQDLMFDVAPARADFGYAPRLFEPNAAMFEPTNIV